MPLEVLLADWEEYAPELTALRLQEQGARYDVRLSRQQALPKVELGYKYEYGTGEHFNGFTAGLSIPILSNRHNVKRAHAMEQAAKANTESALAQQRSSVRELYLKVDYTGRLLESFGGLPDAAGYIDMLGRTLEAGQINIVDYYSELDTFYSALETRIRTDLEYRLGLARERRTIPARRRALRAARRSPFGCASLFPCPQRMPDSRPRAGKSAGNLRCMADIPHPRITFAAKKHRINDR